MNYLDASVKLVCRDALQEPMQEVNLGADFNPLAMKRRIAVMSQQSGADHVTIELV